MGNAVYGNSGRQNIKFEVGGAQAKCGNKVDVVTTVVSKPVEACMGTFVGVLCLRSGAKSSSVDKFL